MNTNVCKACGIRVHFGTNDSTGKASPINVDSDPDGNVVWCDDGVHYHVLTKVERAEPLTKPRFTSHFATCSSAKEFRKPPTSAAREAFARGKAGDG